MPTVMWTGGFFFFLFLVCFRLQLSPNGCGRMSVCGKWKAVPDKEWRRIGSNVL
jgi:hypothetical protein